MPFSTIRREYFEAGAAALERITSGCVSGVYACPVCARCFPRESLTINPWVLGLGFAPTLDIRPLGNRLPVALVCAACLGSSAVNDSLVAPFLSRAAVVDGLNQIAEEASAAVRGTSEDFARVFGSRDDGGTLMQPTVRDMTPSIAWTSFLAAFAAFGYRYAFSRGGSFVRSQLLLPTARPGATHHESRSPINFECALNAGHASGRWYPVVTVGEHVVALPNVSFKADSTEAIWKQHAGSQGLRVQRLPWPIRPRHLLDY
jgi:hypothetical protein